MSNKSSNYLTYISSRYISDRHISDRHISDRYISDRYKISTYIVVSLIIVSLLSTIMPVVSAENIDLIIREQVQQTDTGFLDSSMQGITYLGDGMVDLAIASLLPDREARNDAYKSLLVGGVSAYVLKSLIGKKRPPGKISYNPVTLDSSYHAFPSGHTTTAFALAATIDVHYPEYRYLSYGLASLVGISRLYEDKHWLSDVLAGAVLGYLSARFVQLRW